MGRSLDQGRIVGPLGVCDIGRARCVRRVFHSGTVRSRRGIPMWRHAKATWSKAICRTLHDWRSARVDTPKTSPTCQISGQRSGRQGVRGQSPSAAILACALSGIRRLANGSACSVVDRAFRWRSGTDTSNAETVGWWPFGTAGQRSHWQAPRLVGRSPGPMRWDGVVACGRRMESARPCDGHRPTPAPLRGSLW